MSDASGRERPQTRRRKSLSDKQLAILEVIQRSIARHGYPPSMREIGDAVGLKSLSSVTHQLNQLELSGYLRRDAGKTRAMEVLIDLPGTATENPADTAPAVGDAAMVAVRAAAVEVGGDGAADGLNSTECEIVFVEFLGDLVKLHLLAGNERMLAKVSAEQYPSLRGREGDTIRISWKEEDVQFLD